MTLKELLEKTDAVVYIVDGLHKYPVSTWGLLYDAFGNCVIDEIRPGDAVDALEVTLKMQLVRK